MDINNTLYCKTPKVKRPMFFWKCSMYNKELPTYFLNNDVLNNDSEIVILFIKFTIRKSSKYVKLSHFVNRIGTKFIYKC